MGARLGLLLAIVKLVYSFHINGGELDKLELSVQDLLHSHSGNSQQDGGSMNVTKPIIFMHGIMNNEHEAEFPSSYIASVCNNTTTELAKHLLQAYTICIILLSIRFCSTLLLVVRNVVGLSYLQHAPTLSCQGHNVMLRRCSKFMISPHILPCSYNYLLTHPLGKKFNNCQIEQKHAHDSFQLF